MDLNTIGIPASIYLTPMAVYNEFVLEQYRCKRDGSDIAVEIGDIIIDAGACWGDSAIYFAHKSKPNGKVFSYEFVEENIDILQRNLALNPELNSRIQLVERAVWNVSNIHLSTHGEGPASSVGVGQTGIPNGGPITLSIDDLVQQNCLPRVDFIKMDIEGAELIALRGATQTLQHYRPKLAISVYHRLTDLFEVPELLDSLGCSYRYFLRHYTIHSEETVLFADPN